MTAFLELPPDGRRDLYLIGAEDTGRRASLLEKDVWIVWVLDKLFACPGTPQMTFKGGTSLSKVYNAISRFSEDIDLTLSAEGLAPGEDVYPEPVTSRQRKQLRESLAEKLSAMLNDVVIPHLRSAAQELPHEDITISDLEGEVVWVRYQPLAEESNGYLRAEGVRLEFGGRNAIQPSQSHVVETYLGQAVTELEFPVAPDVQVLAAERTFWEKVTLAHAESQRETFRAAERTSRHWYDLAKLADAGVGARALERWDILEDVVKVKNIHYYTGSAQYGQCLVGEARLVPEGESLAALQRDYDDMVASGMLDERVSFESVIERVLDFQDELNARGQENS